MVRKVYRPFLVVLTVPRPTQVVDPARRYWIVTVRERSGTTFQSAYLFNARSLRESSLRREMLTGNRVVWIMIAIMLVLQVAFVYLPFMNSWFNSAPLPPAGWLVPLVLSIAVFLLVELGKAVLRRSDPR